MEYSEYCQLFDEDLVCAVRKLLKKIENDGEHELEDSDEHNALIIYFNKFGLHKKITETQLKNWG